MHLQTGQTTSAENTLKRNDPRLIHISKRSDAHHGPNTEESPYPNFRLDSKTFNKLTTRSRRVDDTGESSPILIASQGHHQDQGQQVDFGSATSKSLEHIVTSSTRDYRKKLGVHTQKSSCELQMNMIRMKSFGTGVSSLDGQPADNHLSAILSLSDKDRRQLGAKLGVNMDQLKALLDQLSQMLVNPDVREILNPLLAESNQSPTVTRTNSSTVPANDALKSPLVSLLDMIPERINILP